MKRTAVLAALLLLSCEPLVRRTVTLAFDDTGERVTISATTTLATDIEGTKREAQVDEEREALLAGTDPWSIRFANANPEADRVVMERKHGALQSLEHIATVPVENLQKFFFDTPITVSLIHGDGWLELLLIPGTSTRATRRQQQRVDEALREDSRRAAAYFSAVRSMYLYLDEKPQRAVDLFADVFGHDDKTPPRLSNDEQSLTAAVRDSVDSLYEATEGNLDARDFDAVFNPFAADVRVVVPTQPLLSEGFARMADGSLLIKPPTPLEAVGALEGRWITPDPLAAMLRAPKDENPNEFVASIAAMPRRAEPVVVPSEIADALAATMRPAPQYRVRWIVKGALQQNR